MARHLIIRADATPEIGSGHVMRCLALAQAWQRLGGDVTYVSHLPNAKLRDRLRAEGCALVELSAHHPDKRDWECLKETIGTRGGSAVVLDGYHFDPDYQSRVHAVARPLLVLDDIVLHPRFECDFVLNQNVGAERLRYPTPPNPKLLLGTRYTMLRREFIAVREREREIPDRARRVMVTMGGSDPDGVTEKVVEALGRIAEPELQIKIVIGPDNPTNDCAGRNKRMETITSADMPELMCWADVAISAAGSTTWELALLGVPSLLITVADNQAGIGAGMAAEGAAISLGRTADVTAEKVAEEIRGLLHDRDLRHRLSTRARKLVDGEGANRVAAELWATA